MIGLARFTEKLPSRSRPIVLTCVYGLGAGLAAVAFQVGMNTLYRVGIVRLSQASTGVFLVGSLVVIVTSSLAVGYLLTRFAPEASGSGIPQLKAAFWKDFGVVPWRVVWVKYVAGVLSIGGGCSLGREGPSVQLAGGVASNLAGLMGEAKQKRRAAAAAGAAAGLAAAFNTPLAAVTFVLEEIIADLNSALLGRVLLASVIGAMVVHGLVGKQPAFALGDVEASGWLVYGLTPVVAAAAALVGVSACLGAVVRAPVTGILIVFEMTHEFSLVPALMVGALVSQAISRKLCRHSFYEEILVQDGHELEQVIPPRDLRSWQQLPVAAIANFHPVTVRELNAPEIEKLLRAHPYERFPVEGNGTVTGILTRKEAQAALAGKRAPKLEPAVTCLRNQSVAELQARLIESNSMIVVLLDRPGGQVLGVVTLHDLLRAQAAMSEAGAG